MDDKVFALMEKIYIELTDFKNETRANFVKLENYTVDNFKGLHDARKSDREVIDRLEKKVDSLTEQVGVHEVQIKVLKKAAE